MYTFARLFAARAEAQTKTQARSTDKWNDTHTHRTLSGIGKKKPANFVTIQNMKKIQC